MHGAQNCLLRSSAGRWLGERATLPVVLKGHGFSRAEEAQQNQRGFSPRGMFSRAFHPDLGLFRNQFSPRSMLAALRTALLRPPESTTERAGCFQTGNLRVAILSMGDSPRGRQLRFEPPGLQDNDRLRSTDQGRVAPASLTKSAMSAYEIGTACADSQSASNAEWSLKPFFPRRKFNRFSIRSIDRP